MKAVKKEDVTLLVVLIVLGVLTYGWVPGAVSEIIHSFTASDEGR